jgi:arylsulfatase A-like enzyme
MIQKETITRRAALGALAGAPAFLSARKSSPGNVLFIAIDDLNDWIGCLHGHPDVKTPNLDRLAARGMLFTSAYCAAPVCNPSRTALMTGIRPSTSGVYDNSQPFRESTVLKDAITLPQHFAAAGYRVVGGGKIYHVEYPDPRSWQEYYPSQTNNRPADPLPDHRPLNGIPNTKLFDWGPIDARDPKMGDYQVVDWASSELNRAQSKPFFLACGIFKPHLPWYIPQKYFDLYPPGKITLPVVKDDDLDDVPEVGKKMALRGGDHEKVLKYKQWTNAVRSYLAAISFADAQVGRVLDALDSGPHAKNTTVVLWSDHGWHLGEKLHWRKFALWERTTRNVLMIAAPGVTRPGSRCDRVVSLLDIYPTMIDLCGLPKKNGLEGNSIMPLLRNASAAWNHPAVTTYKRGNHAVRDSRWRYIRYHDGGEELYDHTNDPNEWTNLAGKPELTSVKAQLAHYLPKTDAPDSPHVKPTEEGDAA